MFEKIWVLNWNELGVVDVKWILLYSKIVDLRRAYNVVCVFRVKEK